MGLTSYARLVALGAVLVAVIASYVYAYHAGGVASDNRHTIAAAKLAKQVQEAVAVQVNFGNTLSAELEVARAAAQSRQLEVIKNVSNVTNNRACLSPSAVRLLNYTGQSAAMPAPARRVDEEDAGGFTATDRDVSYWIADARTEYQECAKTLNSLITFEERR